MSWYCITILLAIDGGVVIFIMRIENGIRICNAWKNSSMVNILASLISRAFRVNCRFWLKNTGMMTINDLCRIIYEWYDKISADLLDLFWDKGLERSIYDKLVTEVVIKKWIIMMVK